MNRYMKLALIFFCLISYTALRADEENNTAISVSQAKLADNKAKVVLIGMIIQRDHDYFLRDLTGQIKLEFPKDKRDLINTASKVKVEGKIKTNFLRIFSKTVEPTVRVKSVEIFKPARKADTSSDTDDNDDSDDLRLHQ